MNRQEIFDTVVAHLRKQNRHASSFKRECLGFLTTECLYRTPEGLKCAVGCLIPEDKYTLAIEGKTVFQIFKYHPGLLPIALEGEIPFLTDLQSVHDQHEIPFWEGQLERTADRWNLEYRAP